MEEAGVLVENPRVQAGDHHTLSHTMQPLSITVIDLGSQPHLLRVGDRQKFGILVCFWGLVVRSA